MSVCPFADWFTEVSAIITFGGAGALLACLPLKGPAQAFVFPQDLSLCLDFVFVISSYQQDGQEGRLPDQLTHRRPSRFVKLLAQLEFVVISNWQFCSNHREKESKAIWLRPCRRLETFQRWHLPFHLSLLLIWPVESWANWVMGQDQTHLHLTGLVLKALFTDFSDLH